MSNRRLGNKIGVFVDVSNMYRNGGQRLRYEILRDFACRGEAEPVRLNAYVTYDSDRASRDFVYRDGTTNFHSALRDLGYKVIVKEIRWYQDENGNRFGKADSDLDLGVDALLQSENLDRILIASGDGDFVKIVQVLQTRGLRVEVIGLENTSRDLRHEADLFVPGHLIPNMIPFDGETPETWGEFGSRVRGWCYWHHASQSYGFLRYMKRIEPGFWSADSRNPDSPYGTAFFHDSSLPEEIQPAGLPTRSLIFEFRLNQAERGVEAVNMRLAARL